MLKFVFPALLAGIVATPAYCESFPMGRAEINVGWDHVRGKLTYRDSAAPENDLSDSRSTNGAVFGGTVGVDVPVNGYYIGAEASFDLASNKRCEAVFGQDSGCFKVKRNFAIGGRFGVPLEHRTLFYVGVAYVNGRGTFSYTDSVDPANNFAVSDNRDGYRLSSGVEYRVTGNIYTKVEYRYANYGNYKLTSGTESLTLGFDRHQVVGGVGVRF